MNENKKIKKNMTNSTGKYGISVEHDEIIKIYRLLIGTIRPNDQPTD